GSMLAPCAARARPAERPCAGHGERARSGRRPLPLAPHPRRSGGRGDAMAITTGIVLFPDTEELDFVGPWAVLTAAAAFGPGAGDRVVTIAERKEPVRCAKGLRVLPDHDFADAPPLDVVLVPGGMGTRREVANAPLIDWLRKAAASCRWVTSVCTGAL